jgi:acetylornithine deacetylase
VLLPQLGTIDCAIVGEPTQMQMAVAERGLLVFDGVATGRSGHAAREEGENALYKAIDDIQTLRNYRFEKVSELLGPVKISVTMITSGTQHNVVPDRCSYVADVRVNECYTLAEVCTQLQAVAPTLSTPRSMRLRSSLIPLAHPLVQSGLALGRTPYGADALSSLKNGAWRQRPQPYRR